MPRQPDRLTDERAVTPVVGAGLILGLTVVLAAIVGGTIATVDGRLRAPAPTVAQSTGSFEIGPSVGCNDNAVKIVHEGGEPVPPDDIAVVVRLPETEATARLVHLPVNGTQLDAHNIVGDSANVVYDNCVDGAIANGGAVWTAGTAIKFELNAGGGTVDRRDRIEVAVVHEPSDAIIVEATVRAG